MTDILFTSSCFKSAPSALRMAESLRFISGDNLIIFTSPLESDLLFLKENNPPNTILIKSQINNMYICRNWGFIWALQNGIIPTFYCSCDDDIEFTPQSSDILSRLSQYDFSVMTFDNLTQGYGGFHGERIGSCIITPWMNGDTMFTRLEDNLLYGLPDCLLDKAGMPFFVESEYQQRLCALSGKPLLLDVDHTFYIHHWRDDPDKVQLRSLDTIYKMSSGMDAFNAKYDLFPSPVDVNQINIHGLLRAHILSHPEQAKQHLMFNGIWTDYPQIYSTFQSQFSLF